jgi:hypothetical protein
MAKDMLLLYSPESTPRLQYIASHMAAGIFGIGLELITDREAAFRSGRPLVNYSADPMPGAVNILPSGLLSENSILPRRAVVETCAGLPVIFISSPGGDLPFDIFSASFYMLSRYEEYFPFKKDSHGRFPASESLAGRHGLAGLPLVEMWADELKKAIQKKFPRMVFPEREFRFVPTIDVDVPWAYMNRSLWRTAGGFARSVLGGDAGSVSSRIRVLLKLEKDPFDIWPEIEEMHTGAGLSPLFFFPAGTYSRFDKSPPLTCAAYRQLITDISRRYTAGIHPSYYSVSDRELMRREIDRLGQVSVKPVTCSRQHYLRLEIPGTYRLLIENGITDDYTMGWAETPGFRAGTCTPFLFYDLEREQVTSLRIWPFQVMDGTLRDYMDIEPERASEIALGIAGKVRKAGGTLVTLWHNESLTESGRWKNWKRVYLDIISQAT